MYRNVMYIFLSEVMEAVMNFILISQMVKVMQTMLMTGTLDISCALLMQHT